VEQTATSVLNLFPDLELAVEEGEPSLAAEFFNMVRQWVGELREMVAATQAANRASMVEVRRDEKLRAYSSALGDSDVCVTGSQ